MAAFYVTYVVLWILVVVLSLLVALLYRQFGLMLMSGSARASMDGLNVGALAPPAAVRDGTSDSVLTWRDQPATCLATVLLLANRHCQVCGTLWRGVGEAAAAWPEVSFIWFQDVLEDGKGARPSGWRIYEAAAGFSIGEAFQVSVSPFMFVLGQDGVVLAKGLVNSPTDVTAVLLGALAPDGAEWKIPNDGSVLAQQDLERLVNAA